MIIPIALLLYRFLKRFPFVMVVLVLLHFSKLYVLENEVEAEEELIEAVYSFEEIEVLKNIVEVDLFCSSITAYSIQQKIGEDEDSYVLSAFHKLYILFQNMSVDERFCKCA